MVVLYGGAGSRQGPDEMVFERSEGRRKGRWGEGPENEEGKGGGEQSTLVAPHHLLFRCGSGDNGGSYRCVMIVN